MNLQELIKYAESPENSKIRAEIWGDFVNWSNRWGEDEKFLKPTLLSHGCREVLDVAVGDGVDTVFLSKSGFKVSGNEIDGAFRQKAIKNFRRYDLDINPTSFDWRRLTAGYQQASFDAVTCLGNSLVCLPQPVDYPKVLNEFYLLLKPGGGTVN